MGSSQAVAIEGLRVERGDAVALDDVSLEVEQGSVTGLLGPSGSGKSTLMRAIVGVQRITSGSIVALGERAGSASLRRRVGYVTQAPSVYMDITVEENLRYFARLLGTKAGRVQEAIAAVALTPLAGRIVGRLSGGEKARVSLATALLGQPDLLVLDEPTVGLDPVLRRDLWDLFHRVAADGATLLVSSHVMDEADRCDELLLLRQGRLLAAGAPDDLRARTGVQSLDEVFLHLIEDTA